MYHLHGRWLETDVHIILPSVYDPDSTEQFLRTSIEYELFIKRRFRWTAVHSMANNGKGDASHNIKLACAYDVRYWLAHRNDWSNVSRELLATTFKLVYCYQVSFLLNQRIWQYSFVNNGEQTHKKKITIPFYRWSTFNTFFFPFLLCSCHLFAREICLDASDFIRFNIRCQQTKKKHKISSARKFKRKLCKWPKTHLKCRLISCGSSAEP